MASTGPCSILVYLLISEGVRVTLDDAIGTEELRVYPESGQATLNCVSGNGRLTLNSGCAFACKHIDTQGKHEFCIRHADLHDFFSCCQALVTDQVSTEIT